LVVAAVRENCSGHGSQTLDGLLLTLNTHAAPVAQFSLKAHAPYLSGSGEFSALRGEYFENQFAAYVSDVLGLVHDNSRLVALERSGCIGPTLGPSLLGVM